MIISGKQHAANRQNAQHSSRPKTSAGKAAASLNAVTYGLRTRGLLLAGENHEDYHQLCAALEAEWQPQTPTERFYLETMCTSHWLLARTDASEERIYEARLGPADEGALLDRVAARRTRLQRGYTAALHELQQLQKERHARRTQPVEAQPIKPTAQSPQPPAPPPDYVMSGGAGDHPAHAPAATDSR